MSMSTRVKLVALIVAITLIPAVVMLVVTAVALGQPQSAATWASLPAIAGLAAVVAGGRRFAVIVAFVMSFLAPLTIVAGTSPVSGAALMALLALTVGRLSRFGLHRSASMVPVMLAWPLINPPAWSGQVVVDRDDTVYLLWMAGIFFVGAIFPAIVVPFLLRNRILPKPQPHTREDALVYTVMITVLVTVSTFYVLDHPEMYGGAFLIAVLFMLAPIGDTQTLRPTLVRITGTLAGSVFILAIVAQANSLLVVYLIGLVCIVIALMARFGSRAWLYFVFMLPATACLNSTTLAQVGQLGRQRVIDNVVGGALILLASALAIAYSNWATEHGHAHDEDPETLGLLDAPHPAPAAEAAS